MANESNLDDDDASDMDDDYDRGYEAGYADAGGVRPDLEALRTRLNYLLKGGTWGKAGGSEVTDVYIAGFRDAMLSLGMEDE